MAAAEPQPSSGSQDLTGVRVGRFAVRALLGAGGMGEVYRADDTRLKRPVALKRVSRKLGADPRARQHILKEAERASALNSPHIAAVYDVLEENGEVFLVMEYVEGVSLRQRLWASGRVPVAEFLDLALQCAEALAAAQKKGIVHRDIKPENILVTPGGQVKILDFGLAKHVPTLDEAEVTISGESLDWSLAGTPGYMAPEVLLGGEADHRSDIFALGVVFYEMLTGLHPFGAEHRTAAALQVIPVSVGKLVPGLPAELDRIIAKMLAKSPDERYATAADLLVDLRALQRRNPRPFLVSAAPASRQWARRAGRRIALVVVVLLALAIAPIVRQQWKHWFAGADLPAKKNLAVLPFVVVGEDPGAHAFAQGLAETLTGKLAQLTDNYPLQVVPPSEVRSQNVNSVEQARVGLGANLVLEGSLQRSGSQVRITYHLVDSRTRHQLRADTLTASAGDPFAMEDRVVQSVLRSLDLELASKDRRALEAHGTSEPAAYDYYLRGRGYLMEYQKTENVDSAIEVFQRALERDPNYTLAYAGLGESYWRKYQATHAAEWMTRALEACQKAAALGEGAICLGHVYNETGKYEQAGSEFQRALQVDPTSDDAYRGLAFAYEHLGKTAEAEETYRHAIAARPQYWAGYNWLGSFLVHQARLQEAAQMFQQVVALAPDNIRGCSNLGGVYTLLGRYEEAIPVLTRCLAIEPTAAVYSNLATVYFYLRRYDQAANSYERALKLDEKNYILWGNLGEAYYWTPERRDQAAGAYRQAISYAGQAEAVNPKDPHVLAQLAAYHAMLGESKPAREYIGRALALSAGDADLQFKAALIEQRLGQPERALAWLEKAVSAGLSASEIRNNPLFDNLTGNQRFQQLLQAKPEPLKQGPQKSSP